MYDSNSEIIKQYKTSVDENDEYREYVVYKKDDVFVVECIGWKIKSETRSGGNQVYSEMHKSKNSAIEKYDEILSAWEPMK